MNLEHLLNMSLPKAIWLIIQWYFGITFNKYVIHSCKERYKHDGCFMKINGRNAMFIFGGSNYEKRIWKFYDDSFFFYY